MDKVRGGTPRGSSESICSSCRNAQVIKGINNQQLIFCRAVGNKGMRVHFPVYECSTYDNKGQPSLYDMQNIAWVVQSRNRGPVGFAGDGKTEIVVEPPGVVVQPGQPSVAGQIQKEKQ